MADEAFDITATSTTTTETETPDPEVVAIGKVNAALAKLEPVIQQRVLRWAADRFGLALPKGKPSNGSGRADAAAGDEEEDATNGAATFTDFASLYEAAAPSSDADRALLAGYYLQVIQENKDWDGFSANKELKHLGHGTTDITGKLDQLINHKPQLVIQTRKAGTTRQAKKKYKVTGEGIKRVRQMLDGAAGAAAAESGNGGQG